MHITPASLPTDLPALTALFRAYAASLPIDLGYQGFDGELASLPGKYAPPAGALLIAGDAAGVSLGCVAMRPLPSPQGEGVSLRAAEADGWGDSADPTRREASFATPSLERKGCCEMKRLYVAPAGRGQGLGRALALAIIEAARAAGYREMRLDTLAHMAEAQKLYRALGFVEIGPYYDTPIENTVFMSLNL